MTHDNRTGGSYAVIDGELKQVEAPTADHQEGNRARDAHGRALDAAPAPQPDLVDTGLPAEAPFSADKSARPARRVPAGAAAAGD